MKINITVDVQEIFDMQNESAYNAGSDYGSSEFGGNAGDYNLKECIKREIIDGLKGSISRDCLALVEKKSKSAVEEVIAESVAKAKETIAARALEFTEEWLTKKTVISDKWGDPVNELTISELIKQQFDNLLETKVDTDGRPTSYNGEKLINHLTGNLVKKQVSEQFQHFNRNIDEQIKAHIESGIKESVSNKFAEMVIQTAKATNQLNKLD